MQPLAWIYNQRRSAESGFDAQRIFDRTTCNFSSVIDSRKFPSVCRNPSAERQIHWANLFPPSSPSKNQVHVPQKTIPRSTCYWIFLPNPVPEDVPYSWRASTSNNHAILQRNNKSYPWDIHLPYEGEKTNRQQDFRGFAAIKAGAKPNETSPARAGLFHGCANGGISSSS